VAFAFSDTGTGRGTSTDGSWFAAASNSNATIVSIGWRSLSGTEISMPASV
jgi:hypothetical protein